MLQTAQTTFFLAVSILLFCAAVQQERGPRKKPTTCQQRRQPVISPSRPPQRPPFQFPFLSPPPLLPSFSLNRSPLSAISLSRSPAMFIPSHTSSSFPASPRLPPFSSLVGQQQEESSPLTRPIQVLTNARKKISMLDANVRAKNDLKWKTGTPPKRPG
jgi:hypothetical protein